MHPQPLHPDLLLLRSDEPSGLPAANAYAIVNGGRMLLVDAVYRSQLEQVREITRAGVRPAGLFITHRHVVAQANGLRALAAELNIPIYLHPVEATHRQARAVEIPFKDPTSAVSLPRAFGTEALLFPGHTAGHVVLYWPAYGGVLFCGDCARGADGVAGPRVIRTPAVFSENDGMLARSWTGFHRPVSILCPLYGPPALAAAGEVSAALQSLYAAPVGV